MGSEPNLAELVGDILSADNAPTQEHSKPVKPSKNSYKPKGLFLGERRDNGKPVDIVLNP